MRRILDRSLVVFLLVGLGNTVLSMAIMLILFTWAGLGYWTSSAIAFIIASISSFYFNRKYSFQSKGDILHDAWRFALVIALCYLGAFAIAKPLIYHLTDLFSCPWIQKFKGQMALITGNGIFTLFNYMGQRFFAFKHRYFVE